MGRELGPWAGPARPEIQTGRAGPKFKQCGPFRAWAGGPECTPIVQRAREEEIENERENERGLQRTSERTRKRARDRE
jgi:hypothetical protein